MIKRFISALETDFDAAFQKLMNVDPETGVVPDEYSTRAWLMQFAYDLAYFSVLTASILMLVFFTRKWDHNKIEMSETFDT